MIGNCRTKKKKKHSKVSNQEKTLIFKYWKTATLEWSSCNLSLWEWIISGTQYFIQIKKTSCFRVSGLFFSPLLFYFLKPWFHINPVKGLHFHGVSSNHLSLLSHCSIYLSSGIKRKCWLTSTQWSQIESNAFFFLKNLQSLWCKFLYTIKLNHWNGQAS